MHSTGFYPLPPGVTILGYLDPDLRVFDAAVFLEIGWVRGLSVSVAFLWISWAAGAISPVPMPRSSSNTAQPQGHLDAIQPLH